MDYSTLSLYESILKHIYLDQNFISHLSYSFY